MVVKDLLNRVPEYEEVSFVVMVAKIEKRSERIDLLGQLLREARAISETAESLDLIDDLLKLSGGGDDLWAELRLRNDFWYRTGECERKVLSAMNHPMDVRSFAKIVEAFNNLQEFLERLLENKQPD